MNVVNLIDRINARQRKRNMDLALLDEAIAHLQLVRNNSAQYNDAEPKAKRAIFALAEKNEELSAVNRELATAKAGRDAAMLANEKAHNDALVKLQAQLHQLHNEIAKAEAKLESVEKKTAQAGAQYDAYVRGITALKRQLEVAA